MRLKVQVCLSFEIDLRVPSSAEGNLFKINKYERPHVKVEE